jgi:hypothetical protein
MNAHARCFIILNTPLIFAIVILPYRDCLLVENVPGYLVEQVDVRDLFDNTFQIDSTNEELIPAKRQSRCVNDSVAPSDR